MSLTWTEYKETKILLIDVSNLANNNEQLRQELNALVELLSKEPKNSVLAVADMRNTYLNNNALLALMSHAPLAAPYFRKSALLIEQSNARRIILDSLGQFIGRVPQQFQSLEEAKDWLVIKD